MKAEPESDDEFGHIKVGKPAPRKPKKTPRKEEKEHYSKMWALIGSIVDSWCTYKKGIGADVH